MPTTKTPAAQVKEKPKPMSAGKIILLVILGILLLGVAAFLIVFALSAMFTHVYNPTPLNPDVQVKQVENATRNTTINISGVDDVFADTDVAPPGLPV